ncbi:LysR family transcriptional regulator [Murinocardiopsis flavida]|uniref:LysR family transcriptional regulator n=1 Tax=Murinocardiopsis flavida TaxID=645275 RepID=A0A2P8DMM9_9ACTN|nr:LysR family transcriptional regulator [Murinocardiopsis flavida]PSK98462.1 LysR family transcriptional regulator [Murinocardiopsis flavida]
MAGVEIRELECFLALSEELHFGRAAERLYVSQGRVSQLLAALERRIGARLVERTSRRVRLTPLGERFVADLRPPYDALLASVERAGAEARGVGGVVRVGFVGTLNERLISRIDRFEKRYRDCEVEIVELPLADPFGAVRRGEVDAAIVLTPVAEPDMVIGSTFSIEPQTLVVSADHPFADRASVTAEELAQCRLIGTAEPAPRYWREAQAPTGTPEGRPIPRGPIVGTLQEGLTAAAANRGALLTCAPSAHYHRRGDTAIVPVTGLPDSALALIWHQDSETTRTRAFNATISTP